MRRRLRSPPSEHPRAYLRKADLQPAGKAVARRTDALGPSGRAQPSWASSPDQSAERYEMHRLGDGDLAQVRATAVPPPPRQTERRRMKTPDAPTATRRKRRPHEAGREWQADSESSRRADE